LEPTDAELVRQCRKGDSGAWGTIVQRHHTRVYNLAYRFTARFDLAEELTQEIFLKIWRTLGQYRPQAGSFPTWMTRVARNHLIDFHRKHKTELARTDSVDEHSDRGTEFASGAENPGQTFEREERARHVHRMLLELPAHYREAVILRDLEELTYDEMLSILGVPIGTVKSRINRGRIELAKLMKSRRRDLMTGGQGT
jgi:RNA polymerase sigma-70 factor (ECF subfamily)